MMLSKEMLVTGTQVNYYFICRRKLWFFSHNITMEKESEDVAIGKLLHEKTYKRMEKEVVMDKIAIDFVERNGKIIIHEVKKSRKMEKAHYYQLLYYIYFLRKKGVDAEGVINYPLARKTERVRLKDEEEIEKILEEIKRIVTATFPPPAEKKRYCGKCSYFEMCWI